MDTSRTGLHQGVTFISVTIHVVIKVIQTLNDRFGGYNATKDLYRWALLVLFFLLKSTPPPFKFFFFGLLRHSVAQRKQPAANVEVNQHICWFATKASLVFRWMPIHSSRLGLRPVMTRFRTPPSRGGPSRAHHL